VGRDLNAEPIGFEAALQIFSGVDSRDIWLTAKPINMDFCQIIIYIIKSGAS
jgi:hypothetical protein